MATATAVPAGSMRGRHSFGDGYLGGDRDLPDRGPAQEIIGELAGLLRDTRGGLLLGGSVLSAVTIGIALEVAFSPAVLRPGPAGVASVALLGALILCWLRAGVLLLLAGRPVLDQLSDQRWRTGAPVDLRVRWRLTLRPAADTADAWNWTRVNLLLGAARIRGERIHLADTWTFITAACFLAWTAAVVLGLFARRAQAERGSRVSPRSLSSASGWLIVKGNVGYFPHARHMRHFDGDIEYGRDEFPEGILGSSYGP